jgi:hypothetical protein
MISNLINNKKNNNKIKFFLLNKPNKERHKQSRFSLKLGSNKVINGDNKVNV